MRELRQVLRLLLARRRNHPREVPLRVFEHVRWPALLGHPARLEDDDAITVHDGVETVRNRQAGPCCF